MQRHGVGTAIEAQRPFALTRKLSDRMINDETPIKPATSAPSEPAVHSSALVSPQPGEVWKHYRHGLVLIIRAWNERESVCETLEGRRMLLMNELMAKTEAFWVVG